MSARPFGPVTWLLTALISMGQMGIAMYAPSMPSIAVAMGTGPGAVQLTLSVFLVVFAGSQLIYGPLSDRFGRRRVLMTGIVVFAAGSAACAFAPTIGALIAGRAVQAFGACAGAVVGRAMIRDLYDREQAGRVMAVMGMAFAVAPALGPIIGGKLEAAFGWQSSFLFLAGVGAVLLSVSAAKLPETHTDRDPDGLRPGRIAANYLAVLRDRTFLAYLMPTVGFLAGLFTLYAELPFLLIRTLGVRPEFYGYLTLVSVVSFFLGSATASRINHRIGVDRALKLGLAIQSGAAVLYLVVAFSLPLSIAAVLGPMTVWVFGMALALPAATAGALAPFPRLAGTASALMGCLQMAAGAAGSVVVAEFQDGSLAPAAVILALLAALGLAGHLRFAPRRGAAAPGPAAGEP
jgi:DHA1 family bicyclomycin/chloramphenicol resistance-like MFS transporter